MLVGRNISTQHVFNSAVGALCLTICLRVVRGGKAEAGAKEMIELLPKVTSEAWVTVRDNDRGKTEVTEDVIEKDVGVGRGIDTAGGRDKDDTFGQPVHEGDDGVMTARCRR